MCISYDDFEYNNFKMIYFIYGNQISSIKAYIKKISKERIGEADEMNFVKYDATQTNVQEMVDDANYVPLGYDYKVVVAENCYFLQKPKPRNKIESDQDYQKLIDYIKNPNPDCDFIFTLHTSSFDKTSEVAKLIVSKAKVIEIKDPDTQTWGQYVKSKIDAIIEKNPNLKIDRDALEELTNRTSGDIPGFKNNVQKLFLYKEHITYDDVVLMVTRPLEDNVFVIFNHLLAGQNDRALAVFRDLKVNNIEPVALLTNLASQFRSLNQVIFLTKRGFSVDEIANELNMKPGRVRILKTNTFKISEESIHNTLEDLFKLDLQIKSGQVNDRYYAFELFLINFQR